MIAKLCFQAFHYMKCSFWGSCGIIRRGYAIANTKYFTVTADEKTRVATCSFKHGPVNCFDLDSLQEFSAVINAVELAETCDGVILTSAIPGLFSSGIDIRELYEPNPDRLKRCWLAAQQVFLDLYGSKLVTFAAINGHCVAFGCQLAMSCDYRIMVGPNYNIGLNETRVGIVAPWWYRDTMKNILSLRETETALTLGKLYNADEAFRKGLVDMVVKTDEEALEKAKQEMTEWFQIHAKARQLTKLILRRPLITSLNKDRYQDVEEFCSMILLDSTQQSLGHYFAASKAKT